MPDSPHPWDSPPDQWERLKPLAREMRKEPTAGERVLWQHLRNRNLAGFKFRRQHAVGPFIADFACLDAALIVEVDGGSHATKSKYDSWRQAQLENTGFMVMRFSDEDVLRDIHAVLERIRVYLVGSDG